MTVMKPITLLLPTLLFVHQLAVAEVYKWVDENGKAHFSDKAPATEKDAESIGQSLEKTNIDTNSKNISSTLPSTEKTQDEINYEQKKEADRQAAIASKCAYLKKAIDVIASGSRVSFVDENGNEVQVLEKDRDKELQKWQTSYQKLGCQ